jgi:hypothetical protein
LDPAKEAKSEEGIKVVEASAADVLRKSLFFIYNI